MPVHKDDWEGLGRVTQIAKEKYGVSVAADENCRGFADVKKIVEENLADIINIKLAKLGVVGAHEIIELAHASGLHLMISGMVETRISMGFASLLAAGLGCFKFIDLDAPNHLSEDPVVEGCEGYLEGGSRTNSSAIGGWRLKKSSEGAKEGASRRCPMARGCLSGAPTPLYGAHIVFAFMHCISSVCVSMLEDKHRFKFGGVISGFYIHLEAFVLLKLMIWPQACGVFDMFLC
ncbi:L-Ala-D/L-amino acid epimerase-like isoform X1 [Daucus carota subsp. sativus]|uniref:L-Ala-D/L-amino acid epimerase-like isoform X1 n=1 Tax=Daucus carota subsp. sativus TaxID=79200 RepID=UPI003082AF3E